MRPVVELCDRHALLRHILCWLYQPVPVRPRGQAAGPQVWQDIVVHGAGLFDF